MDLEIFELPISATWFLRRLEIFLWQQVFAYTEDSPSLGIMLYLPKDKIITEPTKIYLPTHSHMLEIEIVPNGVEKTGLVLTGKGRIIHEKLYNDLRMEFKRLSLSSSVPMTIGGNVISINTNGGAFVSGDANAEGDFIGHDKLQ